MEAAKGDAAFAIDVPELCGVLGHMGVAKIAITTDDVDEARAFLDATVRRGHEGECLAGCPGPSRAPYPVDVVLRDAGDVEVHDVSQRVHVDGEAAHRLAGVGVEDGGGTVFPDEGGDGTKILHCPDLIVAVDDADKAARKVR